MRWNASGGEPLGSWPGRIAAHRARPAKSPRPRGAHPKGYPRAGLSNARPAKNHGRGRASRGAQEKDPSRNRRRRPPGHAQDRSRTGKLNEALHDHVAGQSHRPRWTTGPFVRGRGRRPRRRSMSVDGVHSHDRYRPRARNPVHPGHDRGRDQCRLRVPNGRARRRMAAPKADPRPDAGPVHRRFHGRKVRHLGGDQFHRRNRDQVLKKNRRSSSMARWKRRLHRRRRSWSGPSCQSRLHPVRGCRAARPRGQLQTAQ